MAKLPRNSPLNSMTTNNRNWTDLPRLYFAQILLSHCCKLAVKMLKYCWSLHNFTTAERQGSNDLMFMRCRCPFIQTCCLLNQFAKLQSSTMHIFLPKHHYLTKDDFLSVMMLTKTPFVWRVQTNPHPAELSIPNLL